MLKSFPFVRFAMGFSVVCILSSTFVIPAIAGSKGYGAIAFSKRTGETAKSYNYDTRDNALNAAMAKCRARDCVAVFVKNQCVGVAIGSNGAAWGYNVDRTYARLKALINCNNKYNNCVIVNSVCSFK